ncbi:MAG TPA: DUF992 domain-containing protein [Xanthobacteraceae bacterium]|jgi:hypothetical protein
MIRRATVFAATLAAVTAIPAEARNNVAVGTLECRSPGAISLILAVHDYDCRFYSDRGRAYRYLGRSTSLGLQAGITRNEVLVWRVYAPTNTVDQHALRGNYAGAHAGAALVVGLGANVLVGGSNQSISLQPVSVEAKTGINFALAGAALTLY